MDGLIMVSNGTFDFVSKRHDLKIVSLHYKSELHLIQNVFDV